LTSACWDLPYRRRLSVHLPTRHLVCVYASRVVLCSIATRLGRPRVHTTLCLPLASLPLKHVSSKADSWFICRCRYCNRHANSIATRIRILLSHVFYSVGLFRLFYSIRSLLTHCIREVLRVYSCGDAGAKWQRGRQRLWRPGLAPVNALTPLTAYRIPHTMPYLLGRKEGYGYG
jgi:hypothetical protein